MIYKATWEDGRVALIRAADEEAARIHATNWRGADSLLDPTQSPINPTTIEHTTSRGAVGVLVTGWENP